MNGVNKTMKLKIYKEKEQKKIVYFRLCEDDDRINLTVVDEKGYRLNFGIILSITKEGIFLHPNVNKDIDLPLDKKRGSVKCQAA